MNKITKVVILIIVIILVSFTVSKVSKKMFTSFLNTPEEINSFCQYYYSGHEDYCKEQIKKI
jgi:cell shape-determining protein MreC